MAWYLDRLTLKWLLQSQLENYFLVQSEMVLLCTSSCCTSSVSIIWGWTVGWQQWAQVLRDLSEEKAESRQEQSFSCGMWRRDEKYKSLAQGRQVRRERERQSVIIIWYQGEKTDFFFKKKNIDLLFFLWVWVFRGEVWTVGSWPFGQET